MDRQSARNKLREYQFLVAQAREQSWYSKERKATMKAVNECRPALNAVLRELGPDIEPITASGLADHQAATPRLNRAIYLLESWYEMTVLSPQGVEVVMPSLPLSVLDPIIARAGQELWQQEKYRQAVVDAAGRINAYAQSRLGRHDISDSALMAEAFKPEPPEPGKPRLRCPGNPMSETVQSMQSGAQLFAMGCFRAIRNPATHGTGDGNPVTSFEQLAALSIVARWVQHWKLVKYVEPVPDISEIIKRQVGADQSIGKGASATK